MKKKKKKNQKSNSGIACGIYKNSEKEQFLNQNGKLYDFKMLYYPTLNEWNGVTSIQAKLPFLVEFFLEWR